MRQCVSQVYSHSGLPHASLAAGDGDDVGDVLEPAGPSGLRRQGLGGLGGHGQSHVLDPGEGLEVVMNMCGGDCRFDVLRDMVKL